MCVYIYVYIFIYICIAHPCLFPLRYSYRLSYARGLELRDSVRSPSAVVMAPKAKFYDGHPDYCSWLQVWPMQAILPLKQKKRAWTRCAVCDTTPRGGGEPGRVREERD